MSSGEDGGLGLGTFMTIGVAGGLINRVMEVRCFSIGGSTNCGVTSYFLVTVFPDSQLITPYGSSLTQEVRTSSYLVVVVIFGIKVKSNTIKQLSTGRKLIYKSNKSFFSLFYIHKFRRKNLSFYAESCVD